MPRLDASPVSNVPQLFQPNSACLPVIDPVLKHFGRVWINMKHVEHTGAVRRWICRDSHQPSLCMLFQRGRCAAGANCNQAHINVDHMAAVRDLLLSQPYTNCCYGHGELASRRDAFRSMLRRRAVEVKYGKDRLVAIPPEYIAVTAFWDRHIKADRHATDQEGERLFRFPWQRVCRLHQLDCCRYGVDCNNVHLCRQFCRMQQLGLDPEEGDVEGDAAELGDDSSMGSRGSSSTPTASPVSSPTTPILTSDTLAGAALIRLAGPAPQCWAVTAPPRPTPPCTAAPAGPQAPPPSAGAWPAPRAAAAAEAPLTAEEQQHVLGAQLEDLLSFWPAHAPALRCAAMASSPPAPAPATPAAGGAPHRPFPARPSSESPALPSPAPALSPATGPPPMGLSSLERQLIREALAAQHMKDIVELGFGRWLEAPSPLLCADPPAAPMSARR